MQEPRPSPTSRTLQQNSKKAYSSCARHAEPRSLICMDSACSHKIICTLCRYEQHASHHVCQLRRVIDSGLQNIRGSPLLQSLCRNNQDPTFLHRQLLRRQQVPLQALRHIRSVFQSTVLQIQQEIKNKYTLLEKEAQSVVKVVSASFDILHQDSFQIVKKAEGFASLDLELRLAQTQRLFADNLYEMQKNIRCWLQQYRTDRTFVWVGHENIQPHQSVVRSKGSQGYKMSLLDWPFSLTATKTMRFKIEQDKNNWVAVGVCHKETAKAKKFGFKHTSQEHGAYVVSSNGGCWSCIQGEMNNVLKSFCFGKGDTIEVQLDPIARKINFRKENCNSSSDKEHFSMDLQAKDETNSDLRFCTVFYYPDDEIRIVS